MHSYNTNLHNKEIDANEWHHGQDGSGFSENVHFSFERVFENHLGCHICI